MKKIIIFYIIILANISIYSEKVDEKTTINSLGQAVLTETYKDDPDGMYKIEWYYKNKDTDKNNLIQSILYFKDNQQFKEKQMDSYKNAALTSSVSYYLNGNPNHWIQSIETNNTKGIITKIYYDDTEPRGFLYCYIYKDINKKRIKDEIFLNKTNNDNEDKEIRYYENEKVYKVDVWLNANNKEYIEKTITYFIDYDNRIIEKQEVKYLNSPNYLTNSELFFYSNGNMKNQMFYFSDKNPKGYVKMEVKWSESGVLYDKKYYDKAGNEVKPE